METGRLQTCLFDRAYKSNDQNPRIALYDLTKPGISQGHSEV
jgi:hypothetical protein